MKQWMILCFVTSAAAVLWPALGPGFWKNNQPSFTKICLYSKDPSQFTPMCVMCPNNLYPIVLTTCVMEAAVPLNVSYLQANCIVGNCAINMDRRKRDISEAEESLKLATSLIGSDIPEAADDDELHLRQVPYTMVVDGYNVTITSVDEYFVHSDSSDEEDEDMP